MALPSRGHLSKGHHAGGRQDGAGDEGRALRAPHGLGGHFCNYKESSEGLGAGGEGSKRPASRLERRAESLASPRDEA